MVGAASGVEVEVNDKDKFLEELSTLSKTHSFYMHKDDDGEIAIIGVGLASTGYTYEWSYNSETTLTLTGLMENIYSVTGTDGQCFNVESVTLTTDAVDMTITETATSVTCSGGDDATLSVSVVGGTGTYDAYMWSQGSATASISGLSEQAYTVTVTDSDACTAEATFTITGPAAITGTDAMTICDGDSVMLGGVYYNTAGTYNDIQTAVGGCDSIIAVTLSLYDRYDTPVDPPASYLSLAMCKNVDFVEIDGINYVEGDTVVSYTTSVNGCDSAAMFILDKNNFSAKIQSSRVDVCEGESYTVEAVVTAVDTIWWEGYPGEDGETLEVTVADTTMIYVEAMDEDGCYAIDSISLNVIIAPSLSVAHNAYGSPYCIDSVQVTLDVDPLYEAIYEEPIDTSFLFTLANGGFMSNSSGLLVVQVANVAEDYEVELELGNGCGTSASFTVDADAGCNALSIADNTFEPLEVYMNNHILVIALTEVNNQQLTIFDVTGRLVYSATIKANSTSIDMNNYYSGIYLVNITDNLGNVTTKKIVK